MIAEADGEEATGVVQVRDDGGFRLEVVGKWLRGGNDLKVQYTGLANNEIKRGVKSHIMPLA